MSLRTRILCLLAVVAAALLMMAATVFFAVRGTDFYRQRVALAHQQLTAIHELATSARSYSEQVAEFLLLGDEELPDFLNARHEVEMRFAELERRTRMEVAFLDSRGRPEAEEEAQEFEQTEAVHRLYREVDRAVERLFLLQEAGRQAQAIALFSAEIERRLDSELGSLLDAAIAGERDEVARAEAAADALSTRMTAVLIVTALLGLAVSLGAAVMLSRSLSGSIGRLMEGAAAIGRGDLGHRIPTAGTDELAVLSRRFNDMAQQLADQQNGLMLATRELESQVLERTAALRDANARLQHLDQSRTQFLADISHELRTPLTILRGEAEVSLRGSGRPEDEYRDTLERIVQQAAQMSRLVDDLLFLARSESDTIRFETRPVALQAALSEAVAAGAALTARRTVRLAPSWPEEPIMVRADPQWLKQAIVILIDNAIKYSEDADAVEVAAARNGAFAEVSVIDRGPGIPPDDLPYVFERFYRGGAGRNRDLAGSGLGLPIARWIAEKHGGNISVTSEPHRRTEFRMKLPLE